MLAMIKAFFYMKLILFNTFIFRNIKKLKIFENIFLRYFQFLLVFIDIKTLKFYKLLNEKSYVY